MISNSTTLLPIMLEQRFGSRWLQNWQSLQDIEARWLAIHLATESANGRELTGASILTRVIAAGRGQLPAMARSSRSVSTLLAILYRASLLPPQTTNSVSFPTEQFDKCLGADSGTAAQA
ncbi:MAG TPA: hypothetical protein VIL85_03730 [Thermomicrobiales bacterium]|jgi:hypothetical protein